MAITDNIAERVTQIVANIEQVESKPPDEPLKCDSLDKTYIAMELEEAFGVEVDIDNLPELKTINDIVKFVEAQK